MQISQDSGSGNEIKSYAPGQIQVNEQVYTSSFILAPNKIITDWPVTRLEHITAAHVAQILELKPEVVLVGTGEAHRFPDPTLLGLFANRGIGVEFMSTQAACRTYNILHAEDRQVVAALMLE